MWSFAPQSETSREKDRSEALNVAGIKFSVSDQDEVSLPATQM
jgi:hypothetical protein